MIDSNKHRSNIIGSSEVAILVGDSEHTNKDGTKRTSADLYVTKKTGTEIPETGAMWFGKAFEKPVLIRHCKENNIRYWMERFSRLENDTEIIYVRFIDLETDNEIDCVTFDEHKKMFGKVKPDDLVLFYQPGQFRHSKMDYFRCQPDAFLMNHDGEIIEVLECKTTSEHGTYFATHSIPKDWLYQATATLMILGTYRETFIIMNTNTMEMEPPYNFTAFDFARPGEEPLQAFKEKCAVIEKAVSEFWHDYTNNIVPKQFQIDEPIPEVKTQGVLKSENEKLNEAVGVYVKLHNNYKNAKNALELAQEEKDKWSQALLDYIVPQNKDVLETQDYFVHVQYNKGRETIDKKKLQANYPNVNLEKITTYGASSCFIRKVVKKGHDGETSDY